MPVFDAITLVYYFNSSDRCLALPHGGFSAKMLMLFFSPQSLKDWVVPACMSIIVVQEEVTEMS